MTNPVLARANDAGDPRLDFGFGGSDTHAASGRFLGVDRADGDHSGMGEGIAGKVDLRTPVPEDALATDDLGVDHDIGVRLALRGDHLGASHLQLDRARSGQRLRYGPTQGGVNVASAGVA